MASCSPFHMKYPDYGVENLESGITFDGSKAFVNRGHPVVEFLDAARERVDLTPLRAKPDAVFTLVAVQVRTMLVYLREELARRCTCNDGHAPRSSV